MRRLILIFTVFTPVLSFAATGDQTVSVGYIQMKSDGLKKTYDKAVSDTNYYARYLTTGESSVNSDDYKAPEGLFLRYRYEYNDSWGVIGSVAYAVQDGSSKLTMSNAADGSRLDRKSKVNGDYLSFLLGPSFRLNEYISLFALAGASYKQMKSEVHGVYSLNNVVQSSAKISDNDHRFDPAYSVGVQLNAYKGLVVDAAYEASSGDSDWKTNGFTVGIGYKF